MKKTMKYCTISLEDPSIRRMVRAVAKDGCARTAAEALRHALRLAYAGLQAASGDREARHIECRAAGQEGAGNEG